MIDTNITSLAPFLAWLLMVISGSLIATWIVIKLTSRTIRKKIIETLGDESIQQSVSNFVTDHIVKPFNELDNNSEIKKLIKETTERSLEIYLKKLKEKKHDK